jgi:hypothetical protein
MLSVLSYQFSLFAHMKFSAYNHFSTALHLLIPPADDSTSTTKSHAHFCHWSAYTRNDDKTDLWQLSSDTFGVCISDGIMFAHTSEQRPLAHPEGDGNGEEDGNEGDEDIEELVWMMGEEWKRTYEGGG